MNFVDSDDLVCEAPPDPTIFAKPFVWRDPKEIPPRQWILKPSLIRGYVSLTTAGSGVGKSTLVLADVLATISGLPLLGVAPSEMGRAWYWNGEDPRDEVERRVHATLIHHQIPKEKVEGRLFLGSGRDADLIIGIQTTQGTRINAPVVDAVVEFIRFNKIDVVAIDPFVSSHAVPENDNMAIDRVMKTWAHIADETNCAVHLSHHNRKTGGGEVTVEDGRGAVALLAASRYARVLRPMTSDEAKNLGVESEDRLTRIRVDSGKSSMTKPASKATWFRLANVHLGNGDEVQAASPWAPPDLLAGLTANDCFRVQQIVEEGRPDGSRWRANVQAGEAWVGYAVAKAFALDPENHLDLATIKVRLAMWLASHALKVVKHAIPPKGKEVPFVEVGRWTEFPTS